MSRDVKQTERNEAVAETVEEVTVAELTAEVDRKPEAAKAAEADTVEVPETVEVSDTVEVPETVEVSDTVEVPEAVEEAEAEAPRAAPAEPVVYETTEDILREGGTGELAIQRPKKNFGEYVRMCGALVAICAAVALVVSFVNAVTADIIAAAAEQEKQAAIVRIFGEGTAAELLDPIAGADALYAVEGKGYCVNLSAGGFGGDIVMMVGVNTDGSVRGVEIVSLAETPGLGSRVTDADYLAQYAGQRGTLTLGGEISAISGATISSRAVLSGVNDAILALHEAGLIGGAGK